jgi:hypothetical protein
MSTTAETTTKPATPSFPFALPFTGEAMHKAMADGFERTKSFWDEYAKMEAQGLAQARTMMGEHNKLGVGAIEYAAHLGQEWRKLAFEASKRTLDMMAGR